MEWEETCIIQKTGFNYILLFQNKAKERIFNSRRGQSKIFRNELMRFCFYTEKCKLWAYIVSAAINVLQFTTRLNTTHLPPFLSHH